MTTDLDTLATALYVKIDDELKVSPYLAPERPAVGIAPTLSDAERLTLAVIGALLGYTSDRRWLRRAHRDFRGMFSYLPGQPGYGKRLAARPQIRAHQQADEIFPNRVRCGDLHQPSDRPVRPPAGEFGRSALRDRGQSHLIKH